LSPRVASRPNRPALPSFRRHRPPPLRNLPTEFEQRLFWQLMTAPSGAADPTRWLSEEEYRVLSKASSGGGFLVPTDVEEKVIAAARAASAVAQVATEVVTAKGETFGVALAGTHGSAAWVSESASYTPSDETITQQNLGAFKGGTKIILSEELMRDEAVELDNYLADELGSRIGALQETAFVTGDGSGKPLGIVHASSPYTVVTAATGSSTSYKLADLVTVYKALPAAYRPNATWLMNADDFGSLAGLVDTAGGLVLPSLQFDPPSLFGRPVLVSADLPTPAANAKSLAFGAWKRAYGIRRVNGVAFQRQDEVHSDTGQVGLRAHARCDGRPLLADAARILAHSAT
jgi:HK97 family phage major capsid protein